MKITMATKSKHKVGEIRAMLPNEIELVTMEEAGFHDDIPETGCTLEENAWIKADAIYQKTRKNVFAEDTGLEIEALDGAPGVDTAIYAGEHRSDTDNINKVISNLEGKENRNAKFRTIVALYFEGVKYEFEGIVKGRIALEPNGNGGFGYDPIFVPDGYNDSFAILDKEIKNTISHRARAIALLIDFLKSKNL